MDDHRRQAGSFAGDKFSFPNVSIQTHQEFEFEFGSSTPRSPNSPADHLFSNGKLLPHSFIPVQPRNSTSFSRSMSRTSSISSKDSSFLSSRSNSTNSSSSSSARTSVSIESSSSSSSFSSSSERSKGMSQGKEGRKIPVKRDQRKQREKPVLSSQQYGSTSSQRWQFIAVPVLPALSRQSSRIKKGEAVGRQRSKKKCVVEDKSSTKSKGFCRRFFASFMSTCRECHAMNPSRRQHMFHEDFDNFQ